MSLRHPPQAGSPSSGCRGSDWPPVATAGTRARSLFHTPRRRGRNPAPARRKPAAQPADNRKPDTEYPHRPAAPGDSTTLHGMAGRGHSETSGPRGAPTVDDDRSAPRPDHRCPRAYALTRRFDAAHPPRVPRLERSLPLPGLPAGWAPGRWLSGNSSPVCAPLLVHGRSAPGFVPAPCQCQTEGNAS